MPSTGIPDSKSPRAGSGAPSSYTLEGPPDSTTPLYPARTTSSAEHVGGRISEYTESSRIRRAMSCVYCDPKSRTAIRSSPPTGLGPLSARAAEFLRLLEDLALGLDRRGDDQLRELEFPDVPGPDRAHARPDRADEVDRAVLRERR